MGNVMKSRRRFLKGSIVDGLRLLALSGGLMPLLSQQAHAELFGSIPDDMPDNRSVYKLTGQVFINGEAASLDTFIQATAEIKTGPKSEIIFVVGEDAHIVRENSVVQLSGQGTVESGLKVLTGKILSVFGKRKKGETVIVDTSTATIGIRGTGLYVESSEESSYVCTCYGVVDIASKNGNDSELITATHHDNPRRIYKKATKNAYIEKAPLINHTDQELAIIEALLGRVPPFPNFTNNYGGGRRKY
jgi:hypothetical protein